MKDAKKPYITANTRSTILPFSLSLIRDQTQKLQRRTPSIDDLMPFHWFDEQHITWLQRLLRVLILHKPASFQDEDLMFPFMLMERRVASWFDFEQTHREVLRAVLL